MGVIPGIPSYNVKFEFACMVLGAEPLGQVVAIELVAELGVVSTQYVC